MSSGTNPDQQPEEGSPEVDWEAFYKGLMEQTDTATATMRQQQAEATNLSNNYSSAFSDLVAGRFPPQAFGPLPFKLQQRHHRRGLGGIPIKE